MRDALVQTLAVDREVCGLLVGKWSTSYSSVTVFLVRWSKV